jgi:hypothetical protein
MYLGWAETEMTIIEKTITIKSALLKQGGNLHAFNAR